MNLARSIALFPKSSVSILMVVLKPWHRGAKCSADQGYILCNGTGIYGNHKETFEATYELIG